jgi:hypothetical protein
MYGLSTNFSWRAAANMDFTMAPRLNRALRTTQYLRTTDVLGFNDYLFGELKQTTVAMTFRGNVTFSPNLSLQLYAEPFVSSGDYQAFRRVADPRGKTFADRFDLITGDNLIEQDGEVSFDLDADGTVDVGIGNPDFTFLSFRSNVVLRWEYMLGSTVFFVWQHGRSGFNNTGQFNLRSSVDDLFSTDATNTVLVKVNYWLSR